MADAADREDTMDILVEMSAILNTGLDKESLRLLMRLCETGANPETLALIVQELRREAAKLKQRQGAR
jgi:mitotic-spindle organizing protein 1